MDTLFKIWTMNRSDLPNPLSKFYTEQRQKLTFSYFFHEQISPAASQFSRVT